MLKSIAVLTSGGDSPGMNAAARAVVRTALYEGVKVWGIRGGYHGLLEEDMFEMKSRDVSDIIQRGGTFLGTARCKRWKTPEGRMMGYKHLTDRGIEGLCVIGGDGSLRGASLLSKETGIPIVGLPGTIDNDVWGSDYTIGCDTAANTIIDAINKLRDTASAHRRVIVLEVMGRNCGWLTYKTAQYYRKMLKQRLKFLPEFNLTLERQDVHAVYVPESKIDFKAEAKRLLAIMDKWDSVNIFVSEGAGVKDIIAEMKRRGEDVPVDAFGHPRLDKVNVGQYVGKRFGELLKAEKVQVFKSGYFARAAAPNKKDLKLIEKCARKAVECALNGESGVVGPDENAAAKIRACEFSRIKGGKPFNVRKGSFRKMLSEIGQPNPRKKRTVK